MVRVGWSPGARRSAPPDLPRRAPGRFEPESPSVESFAARATADAGAAETPRGPRASVIRRSAVTGCARVGSIGERGRRGVMIQNGNTLLFAAAALALGAALGFGASELLSSTPRAPAEPVRSAVSPVEVRAVEADGAVDAGELAAALVDLRMMLATLQGALERIAAAPAPAADRHPVGGDAAPAGSRELAASIEALARALRTLPSGSSPAGGGGLVIPAWVDRKAAFDTAVVKQLYRTDNSGERAEAAAQAWRGKHLFWSRQEVLDRYGKPDEIYRDDGFLVWCYQVYGENESEDFDFLFDGESVARVDYGYDWEE